MRRGLIMAASGISSSSPRSYHASGAVHHSPRTTRTLSPDPRQSLDSPCQPCGIWRNVCAETIPSGRKTHRHGRLQVATYQSADGPRAGVIVDDTLFDAAKLTRKAAYATVVAILEDWKNAQALLKKAAVGAAKANGQRARAAAQGHQAHGSRALALGDLLCRCELRRPCGRDGPRARARNPNPIRTRRACSPGISSKASRSLANPGRDGQDFRLLEADGLGG